MVTPTPFALAEAAYRGCELVHEFLERRVHPRLNEGLASTAAPPLGSTYVGVFLRAQAWMCSIKKLNQPVDFQALAVASRSLFEVAVDSTLLHLDAANPPQKMLAWEDGVRLKTARRAVDYFKSRGLEIPLQYQPMNEFVVTHQSRINGILATYWLDKHKHPYTPPRWTGRPLDQDAVAADRLHPPGRFEEYYETTNSQRNWHVHGSGLAGIRTLKQEEFPGLSAVAFHDCSRFALVAAEMHLRHFGLWDHEVEGEFRQHREHAALVRYTTAFRERPR
jgi:hypothetical protein